MKLREWNARLHGLVVFRSLLDDPVVAKLLDLTLSLIHISEPTRH